MSKWRYFDYLCEKCLTVSESLEDRRLPPDSIECAICGEAAERTVTAANVSTVWGYAGNRGKSDPRPPHVMNTESLAEGQSMKEFREERRKQSFDRKRNELIKNVG